jgi:hypothetical protein
MLQELDKIESIGKDIDKLINIDISGRGIIDKLYAASYKKNATSLTMSAARKLKESLKPGDVVLIATGFPVFAWLSEGLVETDGPIGAAVLSAALDVGPKAIPIVVTEERLMKYVGAACAGTGLIVTDSDRAKKSKPRPLGHAVGLEKFPTERDAAEKVAENLFDKLEPKAIISVEMPSPNKKGVCHYCTGNDIPPDAVARIDILVAKAEEEGVASIGIGDGGNEIGMGLIEDTVRKHVPFGDRCKCPCGEGIAATVRNDILVTASISNWGAYAISACLSTLFGNPACIPRGTDLIRMFRNCADSGAVDGITGYCRPLEDGIPIRTSLGILSLLRTIVESRTSGLFSTVFEKYDMNTH